MLNNKEFIPFCEKYRPADFEDIVLDPLNKTLFSFLIGFKTIGISQPTRYHPRFEK